MLRLNKKEKALLNFDEFKLKKLEEIIRRGVEPYAYKFDVSATIADVANEFKDATHERSKKEVKIAGRIYAIRTHGRALFADIRDSTGKIQIYIREDVVGKESYEFFKELIDTGDIIGVEGNVFRTKMGELTIWVIGYALLSKSLCIMPEKFHGLQNIERRYRQRYLDLICNVDVRDIFIKRSRAINVMRRLLMKKGFIEVETPILQPLYGGANARPFETYHNFLEQKLYLRIAPELYLKRLVVGGLEKVFEIGKSFRNESIDTLHNPEFTIMEVYEAYKDYEDMMELTEEIISKVVKEVCGTYKIPFGEHELNFKPKFERLTMEDAVKKYAKLNVLKMSMDELKEIAYEHKIEDAKYATNQREMLALLFEELVEDSLIQPVFITDFPVEVSPLAKPHRKKEGFAERFELFVNGWELANGFSELNDPLEQKKRFEEQERKREMGYAEAQRIDYDYINALGYALPPTGGVGFGIDRLIMLLANKQSIKEVILFPQMRTQEKSESFKGSKR
ncbi:MAG: lysine--tRNA ligase [Candidatus Diapherotrites archaeon]|nr:lysine--tRNA ligase [Candidatus Diapherotrites archaeon]